MQISLNRTGPGVTRRTCRIINMNDLPGVLHKLSIPYLKRFAGIVRSTIIETVSRNGGHLSPNLGTVEIAVALHALFSSPSDKLIWDVGHQAYPHKLCTGRFDVFPTLLQHGGISGFLKPEESVHDIYGAGHTSTSISVALGLAQARDLRKENYSVVAIIGDASIAGSPALEALNNCLDMKSNFIVLLNDNGMSVSPAVGALSKYITSLRKIAGTYSIPKLQIPVTANMAARGSYRLSDLETETFFRRFGLKYLGPVDGHDISFLISALHHAKNIPGPVLVHAVTKKGKGYKYSEKDPPKYHMFQPFHVNSGRPRKRSSTTFSSVFGRTLTQMAARDQDIIAITPAMSKGTELIRFEQKFPDRFWDVGIAEEHAVLMAVGMARTGLKPVCATYTTFWQRALDQILVDVGIQSIPVTFAFDRAGTLSHDGPTHHGFSDIVFLRAIPNMVIMAPKDGNELRNMLYTAVNYMDGPTVLRYPKGAVPDRVKFNSELKKIPIGKGEIIFNKHGESDVLLAAIGNMVYPAAAAANLLEAQGIHTTVLNARFIKPLDTSLILEHACSAKRVVTVEEGTRINGFGSAVLELLNENGIQKPVTRIGFPDEFIKHGPDNVIRSKYGLTAEGIFATIQSILQEI